MASDSSLRVVEACSCRIKTPVLLLHVIFKQCAPVLGDKCVNCSQGEVREEILDCVLKIWVRSDTPALGFLFSPGGTAAVMNKRTESFSVIGFATKPDVRSDSYWSLHHRGSAGSLGQLCTLEP